MSINLKTLIGKLNETSRTAATRAASICVGLGDFEVDLEHLFLALLEQPNSDFAIVARNSGISVSMLLSARAALPPGKKASKLLRPSGPISSRIRRSRCHTRAPDIAPPPSTALAPPSMVCCVAGTSYQQPMN